MGDEETVVLTLSCGEDVCGEIRMDSTGFRRNIAVRTGRMPEGLFRAYLAGPKGELPLGVLIPEKTCLVGRKILYARDIAALGEPLHGECRRTMSHLKEAGWVYSSDLAKAAGVSLLDGISHGWYRRTDRNLEAALPWKVGQPFPLPAIFCFARWDTVEGESAVVFSFDGEGRPTGKLASEQEILGKET